MSERLDLGAVLDELGDRRPPGISVGIALGGDDDFFSAGITNLDHPLPVTPDTLFQIGSVTKTITATAVVQLIASGDLDLGDLVSSYVAGLPAEVAPSLTIEHLLTHTGGWFGDWLLTHPPEVRPGEGPLEAVIGHLPLVPRLARPGQTFSYDNSGFCVAGRVVEVVSGLAFDEALRARLFAPLGMELTFFDPDDAITHRVSAGHRPLTDADEHLVVARGIDPWAATWGMRRPLWPAGGAVSTARDVLRWGRFHLGGAAGGEAGAVLSSEWRVAMQERRVPSGRAAHRGLSWLVEDRNGTDVVSHNGATQGFVAHLALVPRHQAVLVVLTNSIFGQFAIDAVRGWFLGDLLGLAEPEHPPVPPPFDPALLEGTYETTARRILVEADDERVSVTMVPIAAGTASRPPEPFQFVGKSTLASVDDPAITIDIGPVSLSGVEWLRFRGRLHPASGGQASGEVDALDA